MAGVFLPAGYQMTFTSSDVEEGNYTLVGSDDSYTVVSAGSSVTIGPFALGRQYDVNHLDYSQEPNLYPSRTDIVDEDDMVSDSDILVPTQHSVKAYVDAVQDGLIADGVTEWQAGIEQDITDLQTDDTTTVHTDDTDVSGNSWVLDEDTFSSNSATKVPTQQSTKAYVDTAISGTYSPTEELNVADIANDATGTAIATAVNGILAILVANGLMAAGE